MKTKLSIFIFFILGYSSCVDIIDLELESSEPHPMIEAYIDYNNFAAVSVTMSAAYNDVIDYSQVEATVTLYNGRGDSEVLQLNDSLGFYQGAKFYGLPNEVYNLSVQIDTSLFEVESSISSPIAIDSIQCEYNEDLSQFFQASQEEETDEVTYDSLYDVNVFYTDILDEDNFYLLRLAQNGVIKIDYNLANDRDVDGESMRSMFIEGLALTDTITIYLYSLDKGAYTYYEGLSDLGNSDIPYNPTSNISGNTEVSGFFSARYVNRESFILEDLVVFPNEENSMQP